MRNSGKVDPRFAAFQSFVADSGVAPTIAVVLGSGLGDLLGRVTIVARAPLDPLLGISAPAVAGHARDVVIGRWAGRPVMLFLGRYHLYQGLPLNEVVAPVRALAGTPVQRVLLTNAAGGLNPDFQIGDLMLIADHINLPGLSGHSPLIPPPADQPLEFVALRDAYSPALRTVARRVALEHGLVLREGVYAMVAGPSYETSAELRLLRTLGADAVGMSTVPEVITARSMGLEVLAISTITNRAIPDEDTPPSHDEVLREGRRAAGYLATLFDKLLPHLA